MSDQMPCCPSLGAPAHDGTALVFPRLSPAASLLIHFSQVRARLMLPPGIGAVLLEDGIVHVAPNGAILRHPYSIVALLDEVPATQLCRACFTGAFYAPRAQVPQMGGPVA